MAASMERPKNERVKLCAPEAFALVTVELLLPLPLPLPPTATPTAAAAANHVSWARRVSVELVNLQLAACDIISFR